MYELIKMWFNLMEERDDQKPIHTALFLRILEIFNLNGWRDQVGLPTNHTMRIIGVRNHRSYKNALLYLESLGIIEVQEWSKNQYTSTKICFGKNAKALQKHCRSKAKALQKQSQSIAEALPPYKTIKDLLRLIKTYKDDDARENVFKKIEFDFFEDKIAAETVMMVYKLKRPEAAGKLREFLEMKLGTGGWERWQDWQDFKKNFWFWLKTNLAHGKNGNAKAGYQETDESALAAYEAKLLGSVQSRSGKYESEL